MCMLEKFVSPWFCSSLFFAISTLHNSGQLPSWIICRTYKTMGIEVLRRKQRRYGVKALRAYVKPIREQYFYRVEW